MSLAGVRHLGFSVILLSLFGPASAQTGKWQPLGVANGQGTTICNTSDNLYSCFAFRCGKGRGLEFAFLFNVGDYGSFPTADISVDGLPPTRIVFSEIEPGRELVASYRPDQHGTLVAQLRSGSQMRVEIGYTHRFGLKGSSNEIKRTLAVCNGGGTPEAVTQGGNSGRLRAISISALQERISSISRRYRDGHATSGLSGSEEDLRRAMAQADTDQSGARNAFREAVSGIDPERLPEDSPFFDEDVKQALARLSMDDEVEYLAALEAGSVLEYFRQGATTASLAFVNNLAFELERLKLYELADDFHRAIAAAGADGPANIGDAFSHMLTTADNMIEAGAFDLSRSLATRALKQADIEKAHASRVHAHSVLGKLAAETGDIETGGDHAREALKIARQAGIRLDQWQVDELDGLMSEALIISGDGGSALDGFSRSLDKAYQEYCANAGGYYFEPSDLSIFDGEPALAQAASRLDSVKKLPSCYREKAARKRSGGSGSLSSNMLREIMFFFGVRGDEDGANSFLDRALDPANYGGGASTSFDDQEFASAVGHAYDGLVLAGKGDWMAPRAASLASYFTDGHLGFVADIAISDEFVPLALMFLESGQLDAVRDIAHRLRAHARDQARKYDWLEPDDCATPGSCSFLALLAERGIIVGSATGYLDRLPEAFRSHWSGAGTSAGEGRVIYNMAVDQADYYAARGGLTLAGKYLEIADFWSSSQTDSVDPLSSMDALRILTMTARVEAAKGDRAQANRIAGRVLQSMKEKIESGASFGPDVLLRWSRKIREALDIYLETLAYDGRGEIIVDDNVLTAMTFVQTSGTASTFIKLSARMGLQSGELARRHQELGIELDRSYARLATVEGSASKAIIARINEIESRRSELTSRLQQEAPGYFSMARLGFPTLGRLRELLQTDEAMLATYATPDSAYILWVTDRDAVLRRVDVSRRELAKRIERFRYAMDTNRGYRPVSLSQAHELFGTLFGRFSSDIDMVNRIIFVPHGPFDGLSLPALVTSDPPKADLEPEDLRKVEVPWLARKVAVSVLPSIGSIAIAQTENPREARRYFGIGNADYSNPVDPDGSRGAGSDMVRFPALPETEQEIRTIGSLYGADADTDLLFGPEASEANVKAADLTGYDVISFAAHGIFAGEVEGFDEPALVLSIPPDAAGSNDGLLKASEVAGLRLDAEMVILSACNTAAASGEPGAEGLSGLARSFLFAGARNLAVTHWNVPSDATVSLVTGMARRKKAQPSMRWSEALRHSQMELIDAAGPDHFAHPASWAAFFIVGAEHASRR